MKKNVNDNIIRRIFTDMSVYVVFLKDSIFDNGIHDIDLIFTHVVPKKISYLLPRK